MTKSLETQKTFVQKQIYFFECENNTIFFLPTIQYKERLNMAKYDVIWQMYHAVWQSFTD